MHDRLVLYRATYFLLRVKIRGRDKLLPPLIEISVSIYGTKMKLTPEVALEQR